MSLIESLENPTQLRDNFDIHKYQISLLLNLISNFDQGDYFLTIQRLLDNISDINLSLLDDGQNILYLLKDKCNPAVFFSLLAAGANPDQASSQEIFTPFHLYISNGDINLVKLL